MKYPTMAQNPSYRVSIPEINGGVNAHDAINQVEDSQLTDCKNMWWNDGALQTRPGIKVNHDTLTERLLENGVLQITGGSSDVTQNGTVCRKYLQESLVSEESTNNRVKAEMRLVGFDGTETYSEVAEYSENERNIAFFVESGAGNWDGVRKGGSIVFMGSGLLGNETRIYAEPEDLSPGWVEVTDQAYVPTVLMNGTPSETLESAAVSGTFYEGYNLLTPKFRCTYTTDGKGIYFFLPVKEIDNATISIRATGSAGNVTSFTIPANSMRSELVNGCGFAVDRVGGYVYAADSSGAPFLLKYVGVRNNVEIIASKSAPEEEAKIYGMRFCTWFGGGNSIWSGSRLFVSGNPEHPGLVYWSDVNKPLYFPENNYFYVGNAGQPVTAFGKQGEKLIIFKEHETYCTSYVQGSYTAEDVIGGKIVDVAANTAYFPLTQLHPSIGCDCRDTIQLCDNRLVWADSRGNVYCLSSSNAYSEQTIQLMSRNIDRWLSGLSGDSLKSAFAFDYSGYYILMVGNKAFCLDYTDSQYLYHVAYSGGDKDGSKLKWYVWEYAGNENSERHILKVASNGRKAIALCFNRTNVIEYHYTADFSGTVDQYVYNGQHIYLIGNSEIACMFQTKVFDLGRAEQLKTVNSVYISASNRSQRNATITYLTNKGDTTDAKPLPCRETEDYSSPRYMTVNRFTPSLSRIQHIGIRVESIGSIAVGDISIKYKLLGRGAR